MTKTRCEVYSRIVGYLRPISQWNEGKKAEWDARKKTTKRENTGVSRTKVRFTEKKKAKAKPLPIEVTQDEYLEILKVGKFMHHKVAFMLSFESGLRISEVVNLKKEDIDEGNEQIRINMGKNSKDRIVNLPLSWRPHLIKSIPIKCKQRALQKAFIDAAIKTGLKNRKPKIHYHSLRHGYATESLRSGVDLYTISKLLGHEDISTTTIYAHLCPDKAIKELRDKFGKR